MMERPSPHIEKREDEPKFLGTIILKRHAEPADYKNTSPSLKPGAETEAVRDGERLKSEISPDTTDVHFVSSPLVRAQETMSALLRGMDIDTSGTPVQITRTLRSIDNRGNPEENTAAYEAFRKEGMTMAEHSAAVQKAMEDPSSVFNANPKLFETKSSRDKRTAIAMEYAIRFFEKYHREKNTDKNPLIIAVSHGEILGAFVEPLLGVNTAEEPSYQYGEEMKINVSTNPKDPEEVLLTISYRGKQKDVAFNRTTKIFTPFESTSA